jgi:hypothetical protein
MAEIARATGVSRQTLYELKGKYGDTTDLRLAVLQALGTRGHSNAAQLAEHLGRPESEIHSLLVELTDEGFAGWELGGPTEDITYGGDFDCWLTLSGLRELESWTFPEELNGPKPGSGQ